MDITGQIEVGKISRLFFISIIPAAQYRHLQIGSNQSGKYEKTCFEPSDGIRQLMGMVKG